jgi:MFS family permease
MKRALVLVCLVLTGCAGLGVLHPDVASAADSFTVDEPAQEGQIATQGVLARFGGTISIGEGSSMYAYIDGKLLTCEKYFGNELDTNSSNGCWRIATIDGSSWTFTLGAAELERIGLTFLGPHSVRFVVATRTSSGMRIDAERTLAMEFIEAFPTPSPSPAPSAAASPPVSSAGSPTASRIATGNPAAASVLSSLHTVADAVSRPTSILVAAAVTIILLLLVGLPSALLGQTLSENYERIFGRVSAAVGRATRALASPALPRWIPLGFGISLAVVLSAFVDPGFGWNLGSVRMLVSMGIAFVAESVLGWVIIRAVLAKTDPDLRPRPEFKFGSLVIVLVAVVLSRVVGFEPGMVFGLVVGLAFGTSLATARDARVKLIGLGWALAIGLIGWLGYSLLTGTPGWLPVFGAETLSAIAVSSLAALPVALLPLAGLDGAVLFRWNRWVWTGVYALGLLLFFVVLMPMPFSWGEVGTPLATWVALYVAYAVAAIGVWAWFRFRKPTSASAIPVEGTQGA